MTRTREENVFDFVSESLPTAGRTPILLKTTEYLEFPPIPTPLFSLYSETKGGETTVPRTGEIRSHRGYSFPSFSLMS